MKKLIFLLVVGLVSSISAFAQNNLVTCDSYVTTKWGLNLRYGQVTYNPDWNTLGNISYKGSQGNSVWADGTDQKHFILGSGFDLNDCSINTNVFSDNSGKSLDIICSVKSPFPRAAKLTHIVGSHPYGNSVLYVYTGDLNGTKNETINLYNCQPSR